MEVKKMEIDVKTVPVKVETDEAQEQKMDTGIKMEIVEEDSQENGIVDEVKDIKNDETLIEIIPKEPGLAYLTVNGMVVAEKNLTLTAEEVREYIEKAVMFHIDKKNPFTALNNHAKDIHADLKVKRDEFRKLAKLIDIIERDQLKFLRTDKTLRRFLTKTGGVGVDLPVLPNALNVATNEDFLKKGFPPRTTNFSKPTSAPASTRTATPTSAPADTIIINSLKAKVSASNGSSIKAQKSAPKPAGDIECIDLTDESETTIVKSIRGLNTYPSLVKHPAPLPPRPFAASEKSWLPVPPKPRLKVSAEERGIVLQWDMIPNNAASYAKLSSFDIFGYHEQRSLAINTLLWKKIGSVNAMTLPMACTLTQFIEGNTYHFSIRPVDVHNRCGGYSDPISIVYKQVKS